MIDHRTAFSALFYGLVTIGMFLAPIFIYGSEYSDLEKQGRGHVNGGDILGMITQGLGIHIGILFFFAVLLQFIDLAFTNVPAFLPSLGLKHFYMIDQQPVAKFIEHWIDADWTGGGSSSSPLSDRAFRAFSASMKFLGLALTLIYIVIPVVIVTLSFKYALGGKEEMRDESGVSRVMGAFMFFIGATLLFFIHSLFASALVMLTASISDFSFYHSLVEIWKKLLTGGA